MRVTARKRVARKTGRAGKRNSPVALVRAVAISWNATSNGNELCSSATVSPFTPSPATRPLSATVPLQSAVSGKSRSETSLSARSVVKVAVPLRLVPAAFVAETRQ